MNGIFALATHPLLLVEIIDGQPVSLVDVAAHVAAHYGDVTLGQVHSLARKQQENGLGFGRDHNNIARAGDQSLTLKEWLERGGGVSQAPEVQTVGLAKSGAAVLRALWRETQDPVLGLLF